MHTHDIDFNAIGVDLRILRILQAIQDTGSITQASRLLGLSQPAVSQAIQRAESRVGIILVLRSGKTVKLSEAGKVLYELANTILPEVNTAVERVVAIGQLRGGTVRVASFPSVAATLIPALISHLEKRAPGVNIKYEQAYPAAAMKALRDNQTDIAIVCSYPHIPIDFAEMEQQDFEVVKLFDEPLCAVLPFDHPLASESVIDLADMEDDAWIAGSEKRRDFLEAACQAAGYTPRIHIESDDFLAVVGMVSRGLGVALLAQLTMTVVALPDTVVVRPTNEYRTLSLVVPREKRQLANVGATTNVLLYLARQSHKMVQGAGNGVE